MEEKFQDDTIVVIINTDEISINQIWRAFSSVLSNITVKPREIVLSIKEA